MTSDVEQKKKEMTFGDLSGRIHHDISNGGKETLEKLVDSFQAFIGYCHDENHPIIEELLNNLSCKLKQPDKPRLADIETIVVNLGQEISVRGLAEIEPDFLSGKIDVYKSPDGLRVGIRLEPVIIRDTFLLILEERYRSSRSYEKVLYTMKDIMADKDSAIICGASVALKLIKHGIETNRIIHMDFQKTPKSSFKKSLIMPFKIEELDEIFKYK